MTRLAKRRESASEYEVASEPASQLSSDEKGDTYVVEEELVDFIDDYKNDEYEGTFGSPPSNNRRGGIGREDKGGDFNEALGKLR